MHEFALLLCGREMCAAACCCEQSIPQSIRRRKGVLRIKAISKNRISLRTHAHNKLSSHETCCAIPFNKKYMCAVLFSCVRKTNGLGIFFYFVIHLSLFRFVWLCFVNFCCVEKANDLIKFWQIVKSTATIIATRKPK